MMRIVLEDLSKKFNDQWIFRGINYNMESSKSYAILGSNGSGKSTLLKIISGFMSPTTGAARYFLNDNPVEPESYFNYIAATTPYTELYEELNLVESFEFQKKFRQMTVSSEEFVDLLGLPVRKPVKDFSSGMRQKLKLGLSICSDVPVLLFDEPTNNLDEKARAWFVHNLEKIRPQKLVVVCSNYSEVEYSFCSERLEIDAFKTKMEMT